MVNVSDDNNLHKKTEGGATSVLAGMNITDKHGIIKVWLAYFLGYLLTNISALVANYFMIRSIPNGISNMITIIIVLLGTIFILKLLNNKIIFRYTFKFVNKDLETIEPLNKILLRTWWSLFWRWITYGIISDIIFGDLIKLFKTNHGLIGLFIYGTLILISIFITGFIAFKGMVYTNFKEHNVIITRN